VKLRKLLAERYGSAGFRVSVDCRKRGNTKLVINHDRLPKQDVIKFLGESGYYHFTQDGESIAGFISEENCSLAAYA
jgi:hypothetical protein